jgi:hypothetical protein
MLGMWSKYNNKLCGLAGALVTEGMEQGGDCKHVFFESVALVVGAGGRS